MVNQQDTGVTASSAAALAPQEGLSPCGSQAKPPAANAGRVWTCKIGTREPVTLSWGADLPMRRVVEAAFLSATGIEAEFNFSGWGGQLDEMESAVVENRQPSKEHYKTWRLQETAPALLEVAKTLLAFTKGTIERAGLTDTNGIVAAAEAIIAKAEAKS